MKKYKASFNVIHRLSRYKRYLDFLEASGVEKVSSNEISRVTGLTSSQIRQDLSSFGEFGQRGFGYNVESLKEDINRILGLDNDLHLIMIGVGRIGQALLHNFDFRQCGCCIDAAFDIDPKVYGERIGDIEIQKMSKLSSYFSEHSADIAVLCVPGNDAVKMTRRLIRYGVEAFWNFTDAEIEMAGRDILVSNIHFNDSLIALSYLVNERLQSSIKEA